MKWDQQLVSKPLSAATGCKACGSAFSAKRVLNVPQHASEPFSPRALTTNFSLDLATKQVLKPVVVTSYQPLATKRPAFTLVELLVVISVIALLLALLMPALRGARNQARKVVCRSNLRQFGSVLLMYVEDNEGRLPYGSGHALWLLRGSSPWEKADPDAPKVSQSVRMARAACCPMAAKPTDNGGSFRMSVSSSVNQSYRVEGTPGSRFGAWTITSPGPAFSASYGFNFCPFQVSPVLDGGFFPGLSGSDRARQRRSLNVFNLADRSKIPILLDSMGPGNSFNLRRFVGDPPESPSGGGLMPYCIDRHNGRVNGLFLDWSVREVGLKELWSLKWCPNFDTAGPWTLAGGVQPEDWPEWMRRFKDY